MGGKKKTKWRKVSLAELEQEKSTPEKPVINDSKISSDYNRDFLINNEETSYVANENQLQDQVYYSNELGDGMYYTTPCIFYKPVQVPLYANFVPPYNMCYYYYPTEEYHPAQDFTEQSEIGIPSSNDICEGPLYIPPPPAPLNTVYFSHQAPSFQDHNDIPQIAFHWRHRRRKRYNEDNNTSDRVYYQTNKETDKRKSLQNTSQYRISNQHHRNHRVYQKRYSFETNGYYNQLPNQVKSNMSGKKFDRKDYDNENFHEYKKKECKASDMTNETSLRQFDGNNVCITNEQINQESNQKPEPSNVSTENNTRNEDFFHKEEESKVKERNTLTDGKTHLNNKNVSKNINVEMITSKCTDENQTSNVKHLHLTENILFGENLDKNEKNEINRKSNEETEKGHLNEDSTNVAPLIPDSLIAFTGSMVSLKNCSAESDHNNILTQSLVDEKNRNNDPAFIPTLNTPVFDTGLVKQEKPGDTKVTEKSLQTNTSIYRLSYDDTTEEPENDFSYCNPAFLADQMTNRMSRSISYDEIIIHEADSEDEAGSEDLEIIPHRYESESFLKNKNKLLNKMSLAEELLRAQADLPYDQDMRKVAVAAVKNDSMKYPGKMRNINLNSDASAAVEPLKVQDNTEDVKSGYRKFRIQLNHYFAQRTSFFNVCPGCNIM